jgi:hypothetical protein
VELIFYCVFLLCAVDEVLVANRLVRFPSLLDIGLVQVVAPLRLHNVRRISNDEQRLRELSGHLKGEVVRRTEERDEEGGGVGSRAKLAAGHAGRSDWMPHKFELGAITGP